MADKHWLNYEVRELKLGASFTNNKAPQFHTIKYDFKPASVDVNKMASVDVSSNNQVTVTVPHLDGAGTPQTVFKGNQRPYAKECVLIIDRVTGEATIERLSANIQVKKTRPESQQKPRPHTPGGAGGVGGPGGVDLNTTQRSTSRTRVATNKRTAHPPPPPTHSLPPAAPVAGVGAGAGAGAGRARHSPPAMVRSPGRFRSSPPQAPWSGGGNSTLASLPMLGFDEPPAAAAPPAPPHPPAAYNGYHPPAPRAPERPERPERAERSERAPDKHAYAERHAPPPAQPTPPPQPPLNTATVLGDASSSSSSSDSDSGSGSGSDSDSDAEPPRAAGAASAATAAPHHNGAALATHVLEDDLNLSESGSDSD